MSFNSATHASPHFAWSEFACHDKTQTPYPLDYRESRGVPLAIELERLRAILGAMKQQDVPLWLDSVYRTVAHNKAVGGVPNSQHVQGRAADVRCPYGCTFTQLVKAVGTLVQSPEGKVRYVKFYPHQGFVHLDIRPGKSVVVEDAA